MSPSLAIGSQIRIIYQSNFPTFTPYQVSKMLQEKEYTSGQGRLIDTQNPRLPPIEAPMFSKDNLNIFINSPQNSIGFMILNTINIDEVYEEITTILSSLNITSEVISNISFMVITRYNVEHKPQEKMTSLIQKEFIEGLSSELDQELYLHSINLTTKYPAEKGMHIILEPLISSPEDHYFININYQTNDWDDFQTFISNFRDEMITKIVSEVEKIV